MSAFDPLSGRVNGHVNGSGGDNSAFVRAMEPVALELLGEPSKATKEELRFGTRGSLSVDLRKGTWFDNEAGKGGGVVDLVQAQMSLDPADAVAWLRENGYLPAPANNTRQKEVAAYQYVTADGEPIFEVVRFEPKTFRQCRTDENGKRIWSMKGVQAVLYRLPEVLAAVKAGEPVYIVEGEKSADKLADLGLTATCSPGGANKWRVEYNRALTGADVIILPDNDEPGQKHGKAVKKALTGVAKRIRVLTLPDLPPKGDVFDWLADGGSIEALRVLVDGTREIGEGEPPPLPVVWLDDIEINLSSKDFVQGLLLERSSVVVYGESSAGKMFWTTDLALHVAAGQAWNGRRVDQGGVVYCLLEGSDGFNYRAKAWRQKQIKDGADATVRLPFVSVPKSLDLLNPDADTPDLIVTVNSLAKQMAVPLKLVVVDTLSRALAGGNENDSMDMGALVKNMDRIRAETGACVLFVHHSGKDQAKGARGHSLLRAALDTEIEVKVDHDTEVRTATVEKQRDMPRGAAFAFGLETIEMGVNQHGEKVTTCLVKADGCPLPKARPKGKPLSPKAADLLAEINKLMDRGDGRMTTSEPSVGEVMSLPRNILRDHLIQQGILERVVRVGKRISDAEAISSTDRNRFRDWLIELKRHGEIGFNADCIWRGEPPL